MPGKLTRPEARIVWDTAQEAARVHNAKLLWVYSDREIAGGGWIAIIELGGRQYDIPVWPELQRSGEAPHVVN